MKKPQQQEAKKEVIKHSAAIHIHNQITLLQRRTWNALLYHAYNELESKDEHSIPLAYLADLVGYDSHDLEYLKEASRAMMRCLVEWDLLDKDGNPEWGATTLLAQASVKRSVLTYAYSPALRRRLHNPVMYARLDLNLQKQFDSKYGLALWELCTDYLGSGREYGETPFIAVEDYRKLIGIKEGGYPKFKEFNRCAVKEPMDAINGVSDFRVTVDYRREGRKVSALKFKIRRVRLLSEAQHDQGKLFPEEDEMPLVVQELRNAGLSMHDALTVWQQGFAAVEESVRPEPEDDVEAAFVAYIRDKIHLLQHRRAAGKVEHATGFLLQAIRHNYTNGALDDARQQAQQRAQAQEVARLQAEQAQVAQDHEAAAQAVCAQLAAEAPAVLEQAVTTLLAEDEGFRYLYDRHKTPLANYRERLAIRAQLIPALLQHAPAQVQGAMAAYTTRLAALDARLATLQGAKARATS